MSALKILVIPGSLRSGSLNAKLAAVAAHALAQEGAEITRISLSDFPLPIYDGDLQAKSGVPKHAVNLKRMMAAHHGVLIVTPEYNSSVPALVKNAIDWVSRVQDVHETRGQVFRERVFAIASASATPGRSSATIRRSFGTIPTGCMSPHIRRCETSINCRASAFNPSVSAACFRRSISS